jgi:predicted transcriptional regulator
MASISESMKQHPVCLDEGASVLEAARPMRDQHIGNVIVTRAGRVFGILAKERTARQRWDRSVPRRLTSEAALEQGV